MIVNDDLSDLLWIVLDWKGKQRLRNLSLIDQMLAVLG